MTKNESKGFGVAGLTLGILSILTTPLFGIVAIILGILGLIFSVMQRNRFANGVSTAGIITNVIGIVLGIIVGITMLLTVGVILEGRSGKFIDPNAGLDCSVVGGQCKTGCYGDFSRQTNAKCPSGTVCCITV